MNIKPEDIIGNLGKKANCHDCKYVTAKFGRSWKWCEAPDKPYGLFGNEWKKSALNRNGQCPVYKYGPTLGRRLREFLKKKYKWCWWRWE